jgi:hypothetical protein
MRGRNLSTGPNRGASGGPAGARRLKDQPAANPLISGRCVFKRPEPALQPGHRSVLECLSVSSQLVLSSSPPGDRFYRGDNYSDAGGRDGWVKFTSQTTPTQHSCGLASDQARRPLPWDTFACAKGTNSLFSTSDASLDSPESVQYDPPCPSKRVRVHDARGIFKAARRNAIPGAIWRLSQSAVGAPLPSAQKKSAVARKRRWDEP